MKQNKMRFRKILVVIGIILLVIGISIVVYYSYLKGLPVTTFRELPIEVNLTDENPIFIREVQLHSQDEEVHVKFHLKYNFSRGDLEIELVIGLIEKEWWEALVKEGQEKNITKLIMYSHDYTIIIYQKAKVAREPELRGEPLKLKPTGIKPIYIEILYVSKKISGNISGYIEYEVVSYPNKYKFDFEITIGSEIIIIGLIILILIVKLLDKIVELLDKIVELRCKMKKLKIIINKKIIFKNYL
jgi:hypothetical protein